MAKRKETSGWWQGFDRVLEAYMTWEVITIVLGLIAGVVFLLA